MHLNIAFSYNHKTQEKIHHNVEHEMSFSIMYNMMGIEYGKVEINVPKVENCGFDIQLLEIEVMIATTKVLVHNERVFLLLHNAHTVPLALCKNEMFENYKLKLPCHVSNFYKVAGLGSPNGGSRTISNHMLEILYICSKFPFK